MSLFKNKREFHNNNNENSKVKFYNGVNIAEWIPRFQTPEHMSVYGGDESARNYIVMNAIANCYGQLGIIVIHNNNKIVDRIMNFSRIFPQIYEHYVVQGQHIQFCSIGGSNQDYEPLYGLSEDRAIEAIYPQISRDNPAYMQQHLCVEALRHYFSIIKSNGEQIDLDGLRYLCNLELDELECREMNNINEQERSRILGALSQHNSIYLQVRADVNTFAGHLQGRIWKKKDSLDDASDISMIEAIKHKAILAIQVPSNNCVLDYLATELKAVVDEGRNFLLVMDSVSLSNSLFNTNEMLQASALPFSTVIADEQVQGVFAEKNDMIHSLSKMNKIIIMRCANAEVARVYSDLIGKYMRTFVSTHSGTHRDAFSFFGGYDKSSDVHEELFDKITPEEFVGLGEGAVLIEQAGISDGIIVAKKIY